MSVHKQKGALSIVTALVLLFQAPVFAQTSSSPNYRVDQTIFSSGSQNEACSDEFCSDQTVGDLTVGNTQGNLYQAYAGFNTTDEPFLEFVVTSSNIDLGYLDPGETSTANGTFYVRAWQASGYVVQTVSDPPTNIHSSSHQIDPLTSPSASSEGTEQFGMNLVANTDPETFGADPQQVPDNTFSFGQVAADYDTPNLFKYQKNDVVAFSSQSTSVTIYTISYIFNIDFATPSGQYDFAHTLVATGTY